jgi:hypothetical protein
MIIDRDKGTNEYDEDEPDMGYNGYFFEIEEDEPDEIEIEVELDIKKELFDE